MSQKIPFPPPPELGTINIRGSRPGGGAIIGEQIRGRAGRGGRGVQARAERIKGGALHCERCVMHMFQ